MDQFIEINQSFINVKDIREVEFISDDIYLGLLGNTEDEITVDYVPFVFAQIRTFNNKVHDVSIDLYAPEEDETIDNWIDRNRAYINMSMLLIKEKLNPVRVDNKEYEFA